MANSKRKNRKKASKGRKKQQSRISPQIEVALILGCVFFIFLFLSNFGIGGKVGAVLSSVMFGIFGVIAYAVPILLMIAWVFAVANRTDKLALLKILFGVIGVLCLCGFVELVYEGNGLKELKTAYTTGYLLKEGGGFWGAVIAKLLVPNVGIVCSYIVDIACILICAILLTERSLYEFLKKHGRRVMDSTKNSSEKLQQSKELRRQKREARQAVDSYEKELNLRRNRKVSGVAYDTKIQAPEERSDEMEELHGNPETEKELVIHTMRDPEPVLAKEPQEKTEPEKIIPRKSSVNKVENPVSLAQKKAPAKEETVDVKKEIETQQSVTSDSDYQFPSIELLKKGNRSGVGDNKETLRQTAMQLEQTLRNFGVHVTVTDVSCGPSVTRFELQPEQGVKVSKIVGLADDIKLNLAAADIRIEAPIPGKAAVGIEVPNKENVTVMLRELFESSEFKNATSKIPFSAGKDIGGQVVVSDIGKMPHVLIAGSTGSGKSVCINTIIMSILYKARPDEVKLIMIDPKVVELSVYNGIPHLLIPVVTDPKKAAGALNWAVVEMTERYQKFAQTNVRDLKGYNQHVEKFNKENPDTKLTKMPQIVIIVDELADLMMVAPGDVEEAICRLAQLARAAGIHLILATQRPSVNVITGLIKANMPSRVAFAVSSGVDSRTILDMNGAEKLLGKGDMLFYPQGYQKPLRVQGAFVSDSEVADVVEFLKSTNTKAEDSEANKQEIEEKVNSLSLSAQSSTGSVGAATDDGRDVYFVDAGRLLIEKERGSIGMLQRMFKIGFNRAARIMDQLEEAGVVGPEEGTKPRKILLTMEEFERMIGEE